MSTNSLAPEARPHAFTKAKEIATALGPEWTPAPSHHDQTMDVAWMAYLHGPDLRALTLNMGTWRNGRLTILGSTNRLLDKYATDTRVSLPNLGPMPTISVDPFKDGETIAKDIKRRLLADYEAAFALAVEKLESTRRYVAEREAACAELIRATGGKLSPNFPFAVYLKAGPTLEVDSGKSVRFQHHQTWTVDQMLRIIAAVPEAFGLERDK